MYSIHLDTEEVVQWVKHFITHPLTAGFNLLSAKRIAVDYTLEETKPLAKQRAQYRRAISSG